MDHNNNFYGGISTLISIGSAIFLWVGSQDFGDVLKAIAGVVSIVAGIMAIRYYYFAIKEKKQNLNNHVGKTK